MRERIDIMAPPERVWAVVHEDPKNFTKWTTNVSKIEATTDPPTGKGSRFRYHLDIPGGRQVLEIEHVTWNRAKRCAGTYVGGPVKGTWSYAYREIEGGTRLTYQTDFELTGLLRFATGMFVGPFEDGIRQNLQNLKRYVESGRGPKVKPASKT